MRAKEITGIILAAGASSRMGIPKWKVEISGKSFLDHIVNSYILAGIENITVVFRQMKKLPTGNFTTLINHEPDRGQLSSLLTAVETIPDNSPFIMHLVDRPLIASGTISKLIDSFDNAQILIPSYQKRKGHPVLFPAEMREIILNAKPDSTIRDCIESFGNGTRLIEVEDEKILWNIDSPESLDKYAGLLDRST